MKRIFGFLLAGFILGSCSMISLGEPDEQKFGISPLDVRGLMYISEVHWSGSVDNDGNNYNPDDDFIEIANGYNGAMDIGGWSIVVEGQNHLVIQIPSNTVLYVGQRYTFGNNTKGAFTYFNQTTSKLKLGKAGFVVTLYDGGGQKSADSFNFTNYGAPAGYDLARVKKSMIRVCDYFGALPGDVLQNWVSYNGVAIHNVRDNYTNSVFASPNSDIASINSGGSGDE